MSMLQAIRFRNLISRLTAKETHQFLQDLLNENQSIFVQGIFDFMAKSLANNQNEKHQINDRLKEIIIAKNKKNKIHKSRQNMKLKITKLDKLPKALVGVSASFLAQNDLINLSSVNRAIFIGCHSPNLLQTLDLTSIKPDSHFNISSYPFVKHVQLAVHKRDGIIYPETDLSVINTLQTVKINGQACIQSNITFVEFIAQNSTHFINVTKLYCHNLGEIWSTFNIKSLNGLFAKFPNVKYLQLDGWLNFNMKGKEMKNIYPNLRGLIIKSDAISAHINMGTSFIVSFGNQLQYLNVCYEQEFNYDLSAVKFNNLQELILNKPDLDSMRSILVSAIDLKKVLVSKPKRLNQTARRVIETCKLLQYFECVCDQTSLTYLLHGILKGLNRNKNAAIKVKRNILKIRIVIDCNAESRCFQTKDFMTDIQSIICLLTALTNDFMFILSIINQIGQINSKRFMGKLRELNENITVNEIEIWQNQNGRRRVFKLFGASFVISNRNCAINGYLETWKM